jgi:hypothetical protein
MKKYFMEFLMTLKDEDLLITSIVYSAHYPLGAHRGPALQQ